MKEEKKLVPKLRFPEFRRTEGWGDGQVADIAVSESSSLALNKLMLKSEGFPVYGADSCVGFIDSFDQADDYIAIVKDGSGVGRLTLKKGESSILSTLAYIKCKPGTKNLLTWLYYCLSSLDLRHFIKGSGIPHIYFSDYGSHRALIPSPLEQQKIADCLSSLDELIAAQAHKVDALKTHKKGLMQQLFPREGETQPRLRFPEFRDAGEWERQTVEDFGRVVTGNTPSTAQPAFYGGGIPFVSPADISDLRFVNETKTTLTTDGFAETRHIRAGSTLFVCIGSTIGKVAQNIRDCATNQQINAVVPSPKHSDGFVYFALSFASGRIALLAGKQAVPIINKSLFSSVQLLVPQLPEQQRIADCLSSLDALIFAATQELEDLQTHKKGLMQQLFPALDETPK